MSGWGQWGATGRCGKRSRRQTFRRTRVPCQPRSGIPIVRSRASRRLGKWCTCKEARTTHDSLVDPRLKSAWAPQVQTREATWYDAGGDEDAGRENMALYFGHPSAHPPQPYAHRQSSHPSIPSVCQTLPNDGFSSTIARSPNPRDALASLPLPSSPLERNESSRPSPLPNNGPTIRSSHAAARSEA